MAGEAQWGRGIERENAMLCRELVVGSHCLPGLPTTQQQAGEKPGFLLELPELNKVFSFLSLLLLFSLLFSSEKVQPC